MMIEPISYGWQCPICKRVYNPRQEMCLYCGPHSQTDSAKPSLKQEGISWDNSYGITTSTGTNTNSTISNTTIPSLALDTIEGSISTINCVIKNNK